MAWTGYLALGTWDGTTFVEAVSVGYTRAAWTFGNPAGGRVYGSGADPARFPASGVQSGAALIYNALGFYSVATGGTPVLVYPLTTARSIEPGYSRSVIPAHVGLNVQDFTTLAGTPLDQSQVASVAGISVGAGGLTAAQVRALRSESTTEAAGRAITAADHGRNLRYTGSASATFTLPSGMDTGVLVALTWDGTGKPTLAAGAGATAYNKRNSGQLSAAAAGATILAESLGGNEWRISGDTGV